HLRMDGKALTDMTTVHGHAEHAFHVPKATTMSFEGAFDGDALYRPTASRKLTRKIAPPPAPPIPLDVSNLPAPHTPVRETATFTIMAGKGGPPAPGLPPTSGVGGLSVSADFEYNDGHLNFPAATTNAEGVAVIKWKAYHADEGYVSPFLNEDSEYK